MGKTRDTGFLTNGLWQDASNNIGIGAAASGSYKLQVTGTSNFTSTINGAGVSLSDTLNGTTANFTSSVTGNFFIASPVATSAQSGGLRLNSQVAINARNAANSADITLITTNSSDGVAIRNGALTIASTGAATFSSSVTAASMVVDQGGLNIKGTGSTAQPAMLRLSNASDGGYYWNIWRDNTTGYLNFGGATGGSLSTFFTIKDVTGYVGIGATPTEVFEVKHPSNDGGAKKYVFKGYDSTGNINGIALRVYDTAGGVSFADVGADYYGTGSDTNLTFSTRSGGGALTERMRITSGGYIASVGRGASDAETSTLLSSLSASTSLFPVPTTNFILQYWKGSNSTNYKLVTSGSSYFTGQHGNNPIDMDLKNNIEKYVGLIVSSADEGYYSVNPMTEEVITGKDAITISESLPRIKLTEIDKDKAVWGVVTNVKNDNYNTDGTFDYDNNTEWGDRLGNTVIRVNGVGEGAIWVTNINGNIDNGDYICSSIIAGYGRKQDDDILHNYSVAKATMSCTFDLNNDNKYLCEEFEFNGQIYKKSFIGCTYHCS